MVVDIGPLFGPAFYTLAKHMLCINVTTKQVQIQIWTYVIHVYFCFKVNILNPLIL